MCPLISTRGPGRLETWLRSGTSCHDVQNWHRVATLLIFWRQYLHLTLLLMISSCWNDWNTMRINSWKHAKEREGERVLMLCNFDFMKPLERERTKRRGNRIPRMTAKRANATTKKLKVIWMNRPYAIQTAPSSWAMIIVMSTCNISRVWVKTNSTNCEPFFFCTHARYMLLVTLFQCVITWRGILPFLYDDKEIIQTRVSDCQPQRWWDDVVD